jgi:hypothetical protein
MGAEEEKVTENILDDTFNPRIDWHRHVIKNAEKGGETEKLAKILLDHDIELKRELTAKINGIPLPKDSIDSDVPHKYYVLGVQDGITRTKIRLIGEIKP